MGPSVSRMRMILTILEKGIDPSLCCLGVGVLGRLGRVLFFAVCSPQRNESQHTAQLHSRTQHSDTPSSSPPHMQHTHTHTHTHAHIPHATSHCTAHRDSSAHTVHTAHSTQGLPDTRFGARNARTACAEHTAQHTHTSYLPTYNPYETTNCGTPGKAGSARSPRAFRR